MKSVAIVRKVDNLGRIVVPKEIRKKLRIQEGDCLEVFVNHSGEIILKKYGAIAEMSVFAQSYAEEISKTINKSVLIIEHKEIIAASGEVKKFSKGHISFALNEILKEVNINREIKISERNEVLEIINGGWLECSYVMMAIQGNGNLYGHVILIEAAGNRMITQLDINTVRMATMFLGKYLAG